MRYNIIKSNYGDDNMSNITNHERFTAIHMNRPHNAEGDHIIMKDNDTGVLYYMVHTYSRDSVALTPLLDADGKPIIDK